MTYEYIAYFIEGDRFAGIVTHVRGNVEANDEFKAFSLALVQMETDLGREKMRGLINWYVREAQ